MRWGRNGIGSWRHRGEGSEPRTSGRSGIPSAAKAAWCWGVNGTTEVVPLRNRGIPQG
jgi:hypothetical protein